MPTSHMRHMDMAITTHALTKVYARPSGWRLWLRERPLTAVSNITLSIPTGELFGLLGPNGAGKTTLVKTLCTLIRPTGGRATVAGYPLADAGAIRAVVGLVVADERSFYWRLSARRNLDFFAAMHGLNGRAAAERINAVLAQVDLLEQADRRFSHFSSGMRQRLAIARSLLHQPRILFLDEPSRSLDPIASRRLHALIQQLRHDHEMTIFLITHDLHRGQIQAIGQPTSLRRQLYAQRRYVLHVSRLDKTVKDALSTLIPSLQTETTPTQDRLQFYAGKTDGVLTAVIDHLRQHNITIHTIDSQPPSLEEVFTHFTEVKG
jgi:ABC-2 type transport system ATP-binding protein